MRFPPFFKPKNTTFPLLCPARLRPRPGPRGPPGSAGHRPRGGFALPRAAARGLAGEGGRPLGVGGRRLRAPAGARHSAMLAGAVFLRRVSRPPSRCLSVPGLPPPRGLGSARTGSAALGCPPPPPRPLAGALPLLKRATVADAGLGWPGPRTCSARPPRPTVHRPRGRTPPSCAAARVAATLGPGWRLGRGGLRPWLAHAGGCG